MKTRIPTVQPNILALSIITLAFLQVQSERSGAFGLGGRARAVHHVEMHARPRGIGYAYANYGYYGNNRGRITTNNPEGTPTTEIGPQGTTGPNRNSPYALLDDIPPRDADVQSHSTTNRGPSLNPGAVTTGVSKAREAAREVAMKDPKTAALFKGDAAAGQAEALKRLATAIVAPAAGRLDDKTDVRQKRLAFDTQWAATTSAGVGAHLASLFGEAWWNQNKSSLAGLPWFYYPKGSAGDWWRAATWDGLVSGLGLEASTKPFTYAYGDNVSYEGEVIYVNGEPVSSYDDYVATGVSLADTALPADASVEWIPLGTFAMSSSPDQTQTAMALQLVVDKEGNIGGSYYNFVTNDTQVLQGGVDPKTQRVAFTIGANKTTLIETGLANLTGDNLQLWVHFPDGHSQMWLLVRLKS